MTSWQVLQLLWCKRLGSKIETHLLMNERTVVGLRRYLSTIPLINESWMGKYSHPDDDEKYASSVVFHHGMPLWQRPQRYFENLRHA